MTTTKTSEPVDLAEQEAALRAQLDQVSAARKQQDAALSAAESEAGARAANDWLEHGDSELVRQEREAEHALAEAEDSSPLDLNNVFVRWLALAELRMTRQAAKRVALIELDRYAPQIAPVKRIPIKNDQGDVLRVMETTGLAGLASGNRIPRNIPAEPQPERWGNSQEFEPPGATVSRDVPGHRDGYLEGLARRRQWAAAERGEALVRQQIDAAIAAAAEKVKGSK